MVTAAVKTRANQPCPCGSGKKYKACCRPRAGQAAKSSERMTVYLLATLLLGGLIFLAVSLSSDNKRAPQRVWSEEHGHYHTR